MISLDSVTKRFEQFVALDNLSLEIPDGCAYGMLGSNGAGKSTILRLLSGIYRQESGTVCIDGQEVYDNVAVKSRVIFINDETIQWNGYTLDEMKAYYKLFYDRFDNDKFEKLWSSIKLPRNRKLSTFSKGMKRQAAIICGISSRPDYLLLDEAFDGIDPMMRIIVKQILIDAMVDGDEMERRMTVVMSSHNLREVDEFCDKAGLLHKGKLLFNRDLDNIKGNINKVQTAFDGIEINTKEQWDAYFPTLPALSLEKQGSIIYAIVRGAKEQIETEIAVQNPKLSDIIPLSLEEIFIYEMKGQGYEFSGIDTN
ncbi:MAG: ABC transporter ATP-binding protein [Oscillospiraceae bacterium]|jgi:ABC-2 type transport system ATP-binding protein|nr:ABC transporter ATP-binding protein [Oscillospiraceae bacterium]